MEINIATLEQYCSQNGTDITTNIQITDKEPFLIFILGTNREGSRREWLSFDDLHEILIVNNIIGENSIVQVQLQAMKHESSLYEKRPAMIEMYIYDTLAKYVIQMLNSGLGEIFYPQIIPLEKHKRDYFRNDE